MGRKTFESLPGMLPKRHHIVISKSGAKFPEEVEVFSSIDAFVDAYQTKEEEIFVIGGATIYKQMLSLCHRLILTEINQSYDADVFFPEFDKTLYHKQILNDIMENGVHYQHVEYRLKSETTRD